jgi:exodeoxyribonuclease III
MKVATFNTNSIRSRLDVLTKWLGLHQPDILAIQETKVQDPDFPISSLAGTGYEIVFRGQKKYNGVAILSKKKPKEVLSTLPQDTMDQARFLKATLGDIIFINTYVPQGTAVDSDNFQYKLNWFRWLREHLQQNHNPNELIAWVGDLNVAREDIDVHAPETLWGHVCFCEPVQKALSDVMDWGFIDVFRQMHPEPEHYTFWDYRVPNGFKRNIGWRLDYIMMTPKLAEKCTDCWIDREPRGWENPSDHTFLLAELNI